MDEVFKALADPTRRSLLDELFQRDGQTLGELCAGLEMTRQAVAKHLAILEAGAIVVPLDAQLKAQEVGEILAQLVLLIGLAALGQPRSRRRRKMRRFWILLLGLLNVLKTYCISFMKTINGITNGLKAE